MKKLKKRLEIIFTRLIFFNKNKIEFILISFIFVMILGMAAVSIPPLLRLMLRVDSIDIHDFIPDRNTELSKIALLSGEHAVLRMIKNYYFGINGGNNTVLQSSTGAMHLENLGLYVSTVKALYLREILIYLETYQIPAIMNLSQSNPVLFTGYNMHMGLIHILDPDNPSNIFMNYGDLLGNLDNNSIIMVASLIREPKVNPCINCNHENKVDENILFAIKEIICNNCNYTVIAGY